MQFYRFGPPGETQLVVRTGGVTYDLTSVHESVRSVRKLLSAAKLSNRSLEEVTETHIGAADTVPESVLESETRLPVVPDEVWAAGVTYRISEEARESESTLPAVYQDVYEAERPELFFKATPGRTVGPSEAIGVREDSAWNVPEPELAAILYEGEVVGYTIGNDVSSRDIEGANPLYLPQAKVYDRCCALGPCLVSADSIADPHDLEMAMSISRDGDVIWDEATSTAEMVRTIEELVSYYRQSNRLPTLTALLTGTSLVPGEDVTLRPGDFVRIEIEAIGTLENPVIAV